MTPPYRGLHIVGEEHLGSRRIPWDHAGRGYKIRQNYVVSLLLEQGAQSAAHLGTAILRNDIGLGRKQTNAIFENRSETLRTLGG
jgi:hypothetical protein